MTVFYVFILYVRVGISQYDRVIGLELWDIFNALFGSVYSRIFIDTKPPPFK